MRSTERADRRVLCAIWLGAGALLGTLASADVGGLDAGEIGGAALRLGVAHPTGFALDMLLSRALALLPLGPVAFRQNLGVALIAACAVTAAAWLCLRLCTRTGVRHVASRACAALACGVSLIGSATFLRSALALEVYATSLACLLMAAALVEQGTRVRALAPLCGFALGGHVTGPLLLSPLALRALWSWRARARWHALLGASAGALVVLYLPLASGHTNAFDWGHPATFQGLVRHLSAARIREAFAPELFALDPAPRVELLRQLADAPFALLLALPGLVLLFARARTSGLFVLGSISLDLAYATWINPMGIGARQVGHASAALLAVLAGLGVAACIDTCRARNAGAARVLASALALAALTQLAHADWPESRQDGHAVVERFGANSPLGDLPARAVYVCESDSACASALYAVYAEGARPDLAVVPAQHLWDRSVLGRLHGLPLAARAALEPEPHARRERAQRALAQLMASDSLRPIYFESLPDGERGLDARRAPFLRPAHAGREPSLDPLAGLEHARFGARGPGTALARELWSSAYEQLGKACVLVGRSGPAIAALREAAARTPERAALLSNLGVAYELAGDLPRAVQHTARAVLLDPTRPTPWVNLVRLSLAARGPDAAREVLAGAARQGIADPRLDALRREQAQGTTRR